MVLCTNHPGGEAPHTASEHGEVALSRLEKAAARVAAAWGCLASAEQAEERLRPLEELEEAYGAEMAAYRAVAAGIVDCADTPRNEMP